MPDGLSIGRAGENISARGLNRAGRRNDQDFRAGPGSPNVLKIQLGRAGLPKFTWASPMVASRFLPQGRKRLASFGFAVSENLANAPVNLIPTLLHLPFRATSGVEPVESIDSKNQQLIGEGESHGRRKSMAKMNQYALDEM